MMNRASFLLILSAIMMVGCGGGSVGGSASGSASLDKTPEGEAAVETESEPVAETEVEAEPAAPQDPDDVHLEGDHITIDGHINFATNSNEILEDSHELLDHIAQFLANHAEDVKHLRIIGHTDRAGGAEHNMTLSESRAAAVHEALTSRGVTTVLEHEGKGLTDPLCSEDTPECHAKNRRVEFLVIAD